MKLIDQCCTLDQAKRLKELGVRQESQYYWRSGNIEHVSGVNSWGDQETLGDMISRNDRIWSPDWRNEWDIFSAFTVAELGVMLPKVVKLADIQFRYGIMDDCHVQYIIQDSESDRILVYKGKQVWTTGKTEAEARAAMLIHLIENKLITVEEVNARLCA